MPVHHEPLRIGSLVLSTRVLQSPMADCTDLAFRLVARRRGLEFAFAEMVSANSLTRDSRKTLEMLVTVPEDRPLGAQLVGKDPALMAEAAAMLEGMGFDLIDINMGCPVPKVTTGGEGGGAAMLLKPAAAEKIMRAVADALKRAPLTVKTRIGYADPSGAEAVELAQRAEQAGVKALTVHGRTREQKYAGKADFEAIGRVKRSVSIPVIGNGDVWAGEDAKRMRDVSGCDGVMVGRGGLGNPWLYAAAAAALRGEIVEGPARGFQDRKAALLEHMELEFLHRKEEIAVRHLRRIACWYLSGIPNAAKVRRAVCETRTAAEQRAIIEAVQA